MATAEPARMLATGPRMPCSGGRGLGIGQLGGADIHGINGIAEAVRQIRRTSIDQVTDIDHVHVTAGTGAPTSGLILGCDA